jgi:hypothetical protein
MSGRKVTFKATIPMYVKKNLMVNFDQWSLTLLLSNLLLTIHEIRSAGLGVLPP